MGVSLGDFGSAVVEDAIHFIAHDVASTSYALFGGGVRGTSGLDAVRSYARDIEGGPLIEVARFRGGTRDLRNMATPDGGVVYHLSLRAEADSEPLLALLESDPRVVAACRPAILATEKTEQAGATQANRENKAWSACGFGAVLPPRRQSPAQPIFVIDSGQPTHSDLYGRLNFHGFASLKQEHDPHGVAVAGVISAQREPGGLHGCCDAELEYYNAYRDTQAGHPFDPQAFVKALCAFIASEARVCNISMSGLPRRVGGLPYGDVVVETLLQKAWDCNKMVVCAMPSQAVDAFPASLACVLPVGGATDAGDASYTPPAGACAFVSAPSVQVDLLAPGSTYCRDSGTSYAAPTVAAALWLVQQSCPGLTRSDCVELLRATALQHGRTGRPRDAALGYGVLDLAGIATRLQAGCP